MSQKFIFGIDFDNTIINYDLVFKDQAEKLNLIPKSWVGSKTELRNFIKSLSGGNKLWMRLQGQVYGKYINHASPNIGVQQFFFHCRLHNIPIYIVSHKTRYGHFDEQKINLRKSALDWLQKNLLVDSEISPLVKENVFFANTRKEKNQIIRSLNCTHFIDDLIEVFQEKNFPEKTRKILYNTYTKNVPSHILIQKTWPEITSSFFAFDSTFIKNLLKIYLKIIPKRVLKIRGQRNSQIFKFIDQDNEAYALKIYPNIYYDKRPRLQTESEAYKLLNKAGIQNTPSSVNILTEFNIGIYSWLDGVKPSVATYSLIDQCITFLKKLESVPSDAFKNLPHASEACLSHHELVSQIDHRLQKLKKIAEKDIKLDHFLSNEFQQTKDDILRASFKSWPKNTLKKELAKSRCTLTSSDFGIHNSILSKTGELYFLDFDYFGWDDPVKVACDFFWHPGMNLSEKKKKYWIDGISQIFCSKDKFFMKRLNSAFPLYGLRWCLISLNEYLKWENPKINYLNNRSSLKIKRLQLAQLEVSRKILHNVQAKIWL